MIAPLLGYLLLGQFLEQFTFICSKLILRMKAYV